MKNSLTKTLFITTALVGFVSTSAMADVATNQLPVGASIADGKVEITTGKTSMTINQYSDNAVIDWKEFNIGSKATVTFKQNSADSVALNRVFSEAPSEILGRLNANGIVIIQNQNGVLFGKTGRVDVAGLVATTAEMDAGSLMAGETMFKLDNANGKGSIINNGSIKIKDKGMLAFIANSIDNNGTVTAKYGKVEMAVGTVAVLDLYGDGLIELGSEPLKAENPAITNKGTITAQGGTVHMTVNAAAGIVDSVINLNGVVSAVAVKKVGGAIILNGGEYGTVKVDAKVKTESLKISTPKAVEKVEIKEEVKAEPVAEVKAEVKAEPAVEVKAEPVVEVKTEVKAEAKPVVKAETKSDNSEINSLVAKMNAIKLERFTGKIELDANEETKAKK